MPRSPLDRPLEEQQRQDRLPDETVKLYPNLSSVLGRDFARQPLEENYKKLDAGSKTLDDLINTDNERKVLGNYARDQYGTTDFHDLADKVANDFHVPIKHEFDPETHGKNYQVGNMPGREPATNDTPYTFGTVPNYALPEGTLGETNPNSKMIAVLDKDDPLGRLSTTFHELRHAKDDGDDYESRPIKLTNEGLASIMRKNYDHAKDTGIISKYPFLENDTASNIMGFFNPGNVKQYYGERALRGYSPSDDVYRELQHMTPDQKVKFQQDALNAVIQGGMFKDFRQMVKHGHHKDTENLEVDYPVAEAKKRLKALGFNVNED